MQVHGSARQFELAARQAGEVEHLVDEGDLQFHVARDHLHGLRHRRGQVAAAAERGLRVVLEVQKPLVRLLRGLPGVDRVVAGETRCRITIFIAR